MNRKEGVWKLDSICVLMAEDNILHLDLPVTEGGSGMGRDSDDPACRSPSQGKRLSWVLSRPMEASADPIGRLMPRGIYKGTGSSSVIYLLDTNVCVRRVSLNGR